MCLSKLLLVLLTVGILQPQEVVIGRRRSASVPSGATYVSSIGQSVNVSGGTNYVFTSSMSVASGNALWLFVGWNNSCAAATITAVDNASTPNSFTQIGTNNSQSFTCGAQFYAKNVTGNSSDTVTISIASGGPATLNAWLIQIHGANASSPIDVSCTGFAGSGATASCASSMTTTGNDLVVAAGNDYYGDTFTAGAGYTLLTTFGSAGTSPGMYGVFNTTSTNPTFNVTGTNYTVVQAAAFKP